MDVKRVVNARISRRYHKRLSFRRETDVTNKTFIQYPVDSLAVKMSTFW